MWYIKDQALESQNNILEIKDLKAKSEEHRAYSPSFSFCLQAEAAKQL